VSIRELGYFRFGDHADEGILDAGDTDPDDVGQVALGCIMAYKTKMGLSLSCKDDDDTARSALFGAVVKAYKKVLVVKAIEAVAGGAAGSCWSEKAMVSPLVECVSMPACLARAGRQRV
jgi:hypothetical protein